MTKNNYKNYNWITNLTMVIYHGPHCPDGITAAAIVWNIFKNKVKYIPYSHGMEPPNVKDEYVLILDFAFSEDKLNKMLYDAKELLIIDHHKTNLNNLINLSDNHKIFDMNECGASLTWYFFHPNDELPKFVKYIKDRDIWLKELPFTDEFSSGLYQMILNIIELTENEKLENYCEISKDENINNIISKGTIILDYQKKYRNMILNKSKCEFVKLIDNKYYIIACSEFTPTLKSDIGNDLVNYYKLCDFAIVPTYDINYDSTHFSLRSSDDKTDVSKIAELYGGGGHRNASGIVLNGLHMVLGVSIKLTNITEIINSIKEGELIIYKYIYKTLNVNATSYKLDIGRYLLQKNNDIDIVIVSHYNYLKDFTEFSLIVNTNKISKDEINIIIEYYGARKIYNNEINDYISIIKSGYLKNI